MQDYRERAFVIGTPDIIQIEYNFGKAFSIFITDVQSSSLDPLFSFFSHND